MDHNTSFNLISTRVARGIHVQVFLHCCSWMVKYTKVCIMHAQSNLKVQDHTPLFLNVLPWVSRNFNQAIVPHQWPGTQSWGSMDIIY